MSTSTASPSVSCSPSQSVTDDNQSGAVIITLKSEPGPLGIHVVPFHDALQREHGLVIEGIEPGGRISRDGRIRENDKIVEINGQSLLNVEFVAAQEIFKNALRSEEISLKVLQGSEFIPLDISSSLSSRSRSPSPANNHHSHLQSSPPQSAPKQVPPPVLPKPVIAKRLDFEEGFVEGKARMLTPAKTATVTYVKNLATPTHSSRARDGVTLSATTPSSLPMALVANTRKIGRKYHIRLEKRAEGLGFSITTRDNPAGGNCPIYIKHILPTGSAIVDGRLRQGDRLLEVNGKEMTGMSQADAVAFLKNVPAGKQVDLIVSRQESQPVDASPGPKLPRQLPPEKAEVQTGRQREVLTFEIPLNDTGSAGLGVSVKGKTTRVDDKVVDLGIFAKSIIHGGAASKDGRLQPNDQLISVNGTPLLGLPNTTAMDTLRRDMLHCEGPLANPGVIILTVARRVRATPLAESDADWINHQRNNSIMSTASADSCGDEHLLSPSYSAMHSTPTRLDESFKSADTTVIYKPRTQSGESDFGAPLVSLANPVLERLAGPGEGQVSPIVHGARAQEPIYMSRHGSANKRSDIVIDSDSRRELGFERQTMDKAERGSNGSTPIKAGRGEIPENNTQEFAFHRDVFGRKSMSDHLTASTKETLSASGVRQHDLAASQDSSHFTPHHVIVSTAVNDYSYGTDTQKLSPYYSSSPHSTPTHLDDGYRSAENGVVYPRNQSLAGSFNSTSPSSRSHPVFERLADGQVVSGSLGEPIYVSSRRTPNKIETRADVFIESDSMGGQTYVKQTLEPSQNYGNGSPSKAANAEISLIDAEDVGFHRDGFGRKSISEKRHAHLDAKNTDTYQRNKKAKEQQQLLLQQQQQENIASAQETSNQASSSPERLSGRMNTSAKNTMLAGTSLPSPHHDLVRPANNSPKASFSNGTLRRVKAIIEDSHSTPDYPVRKKSCALANSVPRQKETKAFFVPACCWSCQSPGSCPYHAAPPQRTKPKRGAGHNQELLGPMLGMRKSSSLENLQTMMQDLQRQQLESKGGNPFGGPRPATLKVSRSRTTNESFRVAVDRSYDPPVDQENMEPVAEEGSESGSSVQNQNYQVVVHRADLAASMPSAAALSVVSGSTQCTATTGYTTTTGTTATTAASQLSQDDSMAALVKEKDPLKKKGLFNKFFKFGSRKGKSPNKQPPNTDQIHAELQKEAELVRARRAAQMEKEKIQEQYRRLKEQQQVQQLLQQHHEAAVNDDKYGHYMNYHQIQEQLQMYNQQSGRPVQKIHMSPLRQQQMQSRPPPLPPGRPAAIHYQRQISSPTREVERRPVQARPNSGYYDYEVAASAMQQAPPSSAIYEQRYAAQPVYAPITRQMFMAHPAVEPQGGIYGKTVDAMSANALLRRQLSNHRIAPVTPARTRQPIYGYTSPTHMVSGAPTVIQPHAMYGQVPRVGNGYYIESFYANQRNGSNV